MENLVQDARHIVSEHPCGGGGAEKPESDGPALGRRTPVHGTNKKHV